MDGVRPKLQQKTSAVDEKLRPGGSPCSPWVD